MEHGASTVLVIEDDEPIRALITATLPESWAVLEAADGWEALVLAREHHPHAVLIDHDLPVMNGVDVCGVLRQEPWAEHCRLVALTANDDPHVRDQFTEAGVDAFLLKPFSPTQLIELLESLRGVRG